MTRLDDKSALPPLADLRPTEHGSACLLGVASLVMMAVGFLARNPAIAGCGALMAGGLIALRLRADLHSGISSSNWGTWRHDENRLGFRCNICFWAAATLFWLVLGVLTAFELIPMPSP